MFKLKLKLNNQLSAFNVLKHSIERLASGSYVFGTTKVHLRCVNGHLIGELRIQLEIIDLFLILFET